jgi:aminoglycoside/choline kinase family phosphotransferase
VRVRTELLADLAAAHPRAELTPMVGDASTRRFFRLRLADGSTRVVMDLGGPWELPPDDLALNRILRGAGLPVPALLEAWPSSGCLLFEDLGDRTLESALSRATPSERERMYERAVDLAVAIARRGTPVLASSERASGPALDADRFRFEMDFFLEHFVAGLRRLPTPGDLRAELHALAGAAAASSPPVLCHRDYHSRNLMVREDGSLAMVDVQDARWGPDTYDLASLLCDAYVELDDDLVTRMRARFRAAASPPEPEEAFRARFDLVATERMVKALGTFGFQSAVRGNPRYLEGVPRTLGRLRRTLEGTPLLRRLADLLLRGRILDPL